MPTPKVNIGHGNCAGLPQLSTYAQAQAHYNFVKPIRGDEEVRPLGVRRFKWYRITKKDYMEEPCMYSANIGNTNMVEYYHDGRISITTGGYRSPTNTAFLNFVLMGLGNVMSLNGKWYWKPHRSENYYYFPIQRDHWLHLDGQGIPTNPVREYKNSINRKAMNAVRKKYMPIIEYGRLMLTADPLVPLKIVHELQAKLKPLSFKVMTKRMYWWNSSNKEEHEKGVGKTLAYLDKAVETCDLDMFYNVTMLIANQYGWYSYIKETTTCSPEQFRAGLDLFLKDIYWQDIFTQEEQPIGRAFYDAYASFLANKKDIVSLRHFVQK
jgi:hypothetical protein